MPIVSGVLHLPASAALLARLDIVESTGSTNTDLVGAVGADPAAWPAPAAIATDAQTAGRGRLGRAWSAPPGDSLAISVLLRPCVPAARLGWVSLLAGTAMAEALAQHGLPARTKWPNDVLVRDRKVCGILAEAVPGGVVVGAGLNHAAPEGSLPVPTATSVAAEGGTADADALLAAYLRRLLAHVGRFSAAGGDPTVSGLRSAVLAASGTVGRAVRVALPDGNAIRGTAADIDGEGRVVVDPHPIGDRTAIAAGDVEHLRYE